MALIENAKGRGEDNPGGYHRLFGIPALGQLISRIQSAVISSGNELEKLIWDRVNQIKDLDAFLDSTLNGGEDKVYVANKPQIKASKKISSQFEPDFLGFNPQKRTCYIVEVKDGDAFDTKKAAGEHATLKNFTNDISNQLPFSTEIYLCSFNCATREEAWNGLKRKFAKSELMTGCELAGLFNFNYDEIIKIRTAEQQKNLDYFIAQLLKIPGIRTMIWKRIKKRLHNGSGVT